MRRPLSGGTGPGLAVALALLATGPGAPVAEGAGRVLGGLAAFEVTGQRLGPAFAILGTSALVLLERTDPPAVVRLTGPAVLSGSTVVGFVSGDCTGAPRLVDPSPPGLPLVGPLTAVGPGAVLHVEDGPPGPEVLFSLWNGPTASCLPAPGGFAGQTRSVRALLALGTLQPPFRLDRAGPGDRPRPVPVLVDALDQVAGAVVGLYDGDAPPGLYTLLAVRPLASGAPLVFGGRERLPVGTTFVLFEDGGCAGPPLVGVGSTGAPLLRPSGIGPDERLHGVAGEVAGVALGSFWNSTGAPPACVPVPPGTVLPVAPAEPVVDLTAFTPPFRLGLAPAGELAPGGAGRRPAPGLALVDGQGAIHGTALVGGASRVWAALPSEAGPALVQIEEGAFAGIRPALFEADACAGPARIRDLTAPTSAGGLFPLTAVGPGRVLHVQEGDLAASVVIRSTFDPPGGPPDCRPTVVGPVSSFPAVPLLDLDDLRPPLAAR